MFLKLLIIIIYFTLCFSQYIHPEAHWDGTAARVGNYVNIKKYPYVVAIHYRKSRRLICSGVIISSAWVLSVPMCFMLTYEHYKEQWGPDDVSVPSKVIEKVRLLDKTRKKRYYDWKPSWLYVPPMSSFGPFHFNLSLYTSTTEMSPREERLRSNKIALPPSMFEIWAGTDKLYPCDENLQIREVDRIVINDEFDILQRKQRSPRHELALVKVVTPFKLMWGRALVAPLATHFNLARFKDWGRCKLLGWGKGKTANPPADGFTTLSEIDVQLYNSSACRYIAATYLEPMWDDDPDPWFCSYDNKSKAGEPICQSDSGGPLVCGGKVVALLSWFRSPACYYAKTEYFHFYPTLYSRVYLDLEWIKFHTDKKHVLTFTGVANRLLHSNQLIVILIVLSFITS